MYKLTFAVIAFFLCNTSLAQELTISDIRHNQKSSFTISKLKDTASIIKRYKQIVKYKGVLSLKETFDNFVILQSNSKNNGFNTYFIYMKNNDIIDTSITLRFFNRLKNNHGFISKEAAEQLLLSKKMVKYSIKEINKIDKEGTKMIGCRIELGWTILKGNLYIPYWHFEYMDSVPSILGEDGREKKKPELTYEDFFINAINGKILYGGKTITYDWSNQ